MDDTGPLYNVRMLRGQGYNSFIQEPRIDNAVKITPKKLVDPSQANSKSSSQSKDSSPTKEPDNPLDPNGLPAKAPEYKDMLNAFFEYITKSGSQNARSEAPTDTKPPLPYRFDPAAGAKFNQQVTFSSKQITKTSDINEALGVSASAAIKAGSIGVGGEVGGSLATEKELKDADLTFFVSVKVLNEMKDKDEEMEFSAVEGLKNRLNQIEDRHQRAVEFTRIYGDKFISDFVQGGELYALVRIKLRDKSKLKQVRFYVSAQLTPTVAPVTIQAETKFDKDKREAFSECETSIRIQWRGGGEIKDHEYRWGMENLVSIANAFPSFVACSSARIRAVLTPYSALKSFQKWQHENFPEWQPPTPDSKAQNMLTLSYDHCAIYVETLYDDFNAYSSLCAKIREIIDKTDDYEDVGLSNQNRDGDKSEGGAATQEQALNQSSQSGTSKSIKAARDQQPDEATTQYPDIPKSVMTKFNLKGLKPLAKPGQAIERDAQSLSDIRLLCRSAMIYIQEQAAELVVDPKRAMIEECEGTPVVLPQKYPCPGVIASLMPRKVKRREGNDDNWGATTPDLMDKRPSEIQDDPSKFDIDTTGDLLSPDKSYEYFKLGNFDVNDDRYPCGLCIHGYTRRWWNFRNKALKNSDNAICGIGLKYDADSDGSQVFPTKTYFRGQKSKRVAERDWDPKGIPRPVYFNKVVSHFVPGTGRIAGLRICTTDSENGPEDVLLTHKQWHLPLARKRADFEETEASIDGPKAMSWRWTMALDPTDHDRWMFAGIFGAFEKVGLFGRDRVLAKIAIVWKKVPQHE